MFITGLIHDIGKLAICMILPKQFSEVVKMAEPFELRTLEAEQHILGVTHDEIGGRLLKNWLFPERMVAGVRFHHRFDMDDSWTPYPLLINVADCLAHLSSPGAGQEDDGMLQADYFAADIIAVAQANGIDLSPQALERYKNELNAQKDTQAELMEILLA